MVASSTIMSWAVAMTARARPSRRGAAAPVLGEAATDGAAVLTSRAAVPLRAACCPVSGGVADKIISPSISSALNYRRDRSGVMVTVSARFFSAERTADQPP
jgi:hypothetical protein